MKIYYFDAESGIYQGEDFEDERLFLGRGVFRIPPFSTTTAPPDYRQGQAPFYDKKTDNWEIRDLPRETNTQSCRKNPTHASSSPTSR